MKRLFTTRFVTIALVSLLVVFIALEIILRTLWGFCDTVLYQADKDFEYIEQPNQDRVRFGHKVVYNEYCMRSKPLEENQCVVLGFGDSVINGGVLTDQDSIATTIVEKQLNNGTRFLNISAGSWGPDNCAQYLKKYGDFKARMIVLFISSHDAHDNMTFEPVVGYDESYPEKQYFLATAEVFNRYILPRIKGLISSGNSKDNLMINKNGQGFNTGFDYFRDYTQKHNIPFIVCLHAERIEVEQGRYNSQGDEIIDYCAKNNINLIKGLDIGENLGDFRDEIHINERGQKRWANVLAPAIQNIVKECL